MIYRAPGEPQRRELDCHAYRRILPVGGLPGLVAVGEGLRQEAVAGPHPGLPQAVADGALIDASAPIGHARGGALCPPRSESGR